MATEFMKIIRRMKLSKALHYKRDYLTWYLLPINEPDYEPSDDGVLAEDEQRFLLIWSCPLMHGVNDCIPHALNRFCQK